MKKSKRIRNALAVAMRYGAVDGAHHKAWVIDQIVRCLTGCVEERKTAVDANGNPYSFDALGESQEYLDWVAENNSGEDGPDTYSWDKGIAP